MDPSSVDFRNFFPYIPNEVKHRKRTSAEQAKVLEGIFATNPKPDSKLRARLAEELDMKPRGVQVWFQNRRAKEKLVSQKLQAATVNAARKAEKKKATKDEAGTQPPSPAEYHSSPDSSRQPSSSPESSPAPLTADIPLPEIAPASPAYDLSPKIMSSAVRQPDPPRAAPDLYSLRRGSLPNLMGAHTPLLRTPRPVPHLLARRGSVERLRSNPFAQYLHARPRAVPYRSRQTSLRESFAEFEGPAHDDASRGVDAALAEARDQHSALVAPGVARRTLTHRASLPHVLAGVDMTRRASMPAGTGALPAFAQSRMVAAPIPGPLPAPGYSFGGAAPDFAGFSFGENDTEEDNTSAASYDPWSRFGSIASTSSTTSANFSDVGSCGEVPAPQGWNPEARRESFASSEQFSSLVSRLDLSHERSKSNGDIHIDIGRPVPYAHQQAFTGEVGESSNGHVEYPSPSSTISPGVNFHSGPSCLGQLPNPSSQSLPVSASSELAHALQPDSGSHITRTASFPANAAVPHAPQASYVARSYSEGQAGYSGLAFNHPLPCDQPMDAAGHPKNFMDVSVGQYAAPEYYPTNHSTQPAQPQSQHAEYHQAPFDDIVELHHAMEFRTSGFVAGAVDMSRVTSVVENTLHTPLDSASFMHYL
ncbi:hypothetical protein HWV62_29688 [Athelia sp. TMB]|nr:hypothetical protein HWV62_29688 [Athelia sp. TMB]